MTPIYLDHHASTPVDPAVVAAMQPYWSELYANPHSRQHRPGWMAGAAVTAARRSVAALIGAGPDEILFTSGATEANNLAIKGAAYHDRARGRHIITVATEHPSVLAPCRRLAAEGFDLTILPVPADGRLEPKTLAASLRADTILVSVMAANHEIGVIPDLAAIGAICRQRGILLHSDIVQAAGKIPLDMRKLGIGLATLSAHKLYGPKGVGALYRRLDPRVDLVPLMEGGGQEQGLRPGTVPTALCVGFGAAADLAARAMPGETVRLAGLTAHLLARLKSAWPGLLVNGDPRHRLAGSLNLCFPGVDAGKLLEDLPGLALATGSACAAAEGVPSSVLRAIGLDDRDVAASLRLSLGRFTSAAEIDGAADQIIGALRR